jgi:hypothetical protein
MRVIVGAAVGARVTVGGARGGMGEIGGTDDGGGVALRIAVERGETGGAVGVGGAQAASTIKPRINGRRFRIGSFRCPRITQNARDARITHGNSGYAATGAYATPTRLGPVCAPSTGAIELVGNQAHLKS